MPEVFIANLGVTITGSSTRPLLRILQDHYIDWMHACGGKGRCTTCKAIFIAGEENTQPLTPAELKYAQSGALKNGERLACQVCITGNVVVKVPDEGKLPHVKYLDDPF